MEFFLYTFSSDYLKEKFIALDNAALLASKLPKATPHVFFTRNIHKDCKCDILVVETLKKDVFLCERTQKLAKTVLVTPTPFSSLDALLASGTDSRLVCMNKGEVLFTTDAVPMHKPAETELEKFSKQFSIERSHELDDFASLLDVGMLKRRLWLVGSIGRVSEGGGERPFTLRISRRPRREGRVVHIRSITFTYRAMFRSSTGEPSELRPLNSIRQHERRRMRRRRVEDSEEMHEESGCSYVFSNEVEEGNVLLEEIEDEEKILLDDVQVLSSDHVLLDEEHVFKIRRMMMGLSDRVAERRRRRMRRRMGFMPEPSEHLS